MARYQLIEFAELDSTNRHACANLRDLADGDVIQAAVQTAGHGRMRRRWVSDVPGNLCISIVLKPFHAPPVDLPLANLSQLLALGVCRVLDAHGFPATLKWPNDVRVCGHKIAGLLAETVVQGGEFLGLVLGLGVNLNLDARSLATIDQPATSLAELSGKPVDVAVFRDAVLRDFFNHCDTLMASGFETIRDEYMERCPFIGTEVGIRRGGETIQGLALGMTVDGAIEIMVEGGEVRVVELGEMF